MDRFCNFTHISAGFIAMLVGYTSSAAIVIQAATAAGATSPEQLGSWLWALGIGMGITCIGLSWYFRAPIVTAWSTGGAALLVTALSGVSINEAVGAFIFSSALITLCGVTGCFSWIIKHVPKHLAAATLCGILLRFGLDLFTALKIQMSLVFCMLITYFIAKQLMPKYKILLSFIAGLAFCFFNDLIGITNLNVTLASPQFVKPSFSLDTIISVGIPLFVVTMASQNIPGIALLRAHGYNTPASPIISWTGITGILLAPFGGYAFNIAVLTAAICMNSEVAEHKEKRYPAAMWAGIFYFILGLLGATVANIFAILPKEFIAAIAGIALLGTIIQSMTDALEAGNDREVAIVTFLITASGISIAGIGSAFWGLLIGVIVANLSISYQSFIASTHRAA